VGSGVTYYYMAVLEAGLCEAEIYVNGIPVVRAERDERYHVRPVNHYLLPGNNIFALAVHLGPFPSRAWMRFPLQLFPIPGAYAHASLWRVPEGLHVGDPGSVLIQQSEWRDDGTPVVSTLPFARDFVVPPGEVPPPLWMDCDPLDRDQALDVIPVLRELSRTLANGDPELFLARSRPRFEHCAAAFGVDIQAEIDNFRQQRARYPLARFQEVNAAAFRPRVVARGRLVDCLDQDWSSPLRSEPDETGAIKLTYRVRMGRRKGEWGIYL